MSDGVDRRRFLQVGAASAAGLAAVGGLAACGSDSSSGGGASSVATTGGAAGGPRRGGTLRYATSGGSNKDTADPVKTLNAFTLVTACQIYDTLLRTDLDFRLIPSLATEWEMSGEGRVWTFRLRDGVAFHDGRRLGSKDVAFSIARVLDPRNGSNVLGNVEPFLKPSGIATPDPTTLVLTLEAPNVFFPLLLTQPAFGVVPDGTTDFARGIGTGPFRLGSFQALASARFPRNEEYWNEGKPYLDGVELSYMAEDATRVQAVVSGSKDLVDTITGANIKQLTGQAEAMAIDDSAWVTLAAWADAKPFSDPRVVQAMKFAQDREKIMNVVAPDLGRPGADVPIPQSDLFHPAGLQPRPYDPEQAKALLKEAGFGDGLDLTLYAYKGDKLDCALAYKDTAAAAGINVRVVNWPHATYWDQVWMKKPFVGDSWARLHASAILPQVFGSRSSSNESHFKNAAFDRLLAEALRTPEEARQKEIYGEAIRIVDDHSSALIPGWYPNVLGKSKKVNDVQVASGGALVYLDSAWLA
jgi:peptide/nickel transport system substrate-binding protein